MSHNQLNIQEIQKCIYQQLYSQNILLHQLNANSNQRIGDILQQQTISTQKIMQNSNQFILQLMQNTNLNGQHANHTKFNTTSHHHHPIHQQNSQQISYPISSNSHKQNSIKSMQSAMNHDHLKSRNTELPLHVSKVIQPKQTKKRIPPSSLTNTSLSKSTNHYKCCECNATVLRIYRIRCRDCRGVYCRDCYNNDKVRIIRECPHCLKKKCKDCWGKYQSIWTGDKCDDCDFWSCC